MDRRILAFAFLAAGLLAHLLGLGFGVLRPVYLVMTALPYLALALASFAGSGRGAILGGGVLLLLGQITGSALSMYLVSQLRSDGPSATGGMRWFTVLMLLQPPASTVFVLPIGLWLGKRIGLRFGLDDGSSAVVRASAAAGRSALRLARFIALAAVVLVVVTTLFAGNLRALPLALWALLPYGLLYLAAKRLADPWVIGGAGAVALAAEIGVRASVFLFSHSSTAAIGLVFSPFYISILFLPGGAAAGWLMGRLWRTGALSLRGAVIVLSTAALGLTVLGLARPELFPTAVHRRKQAQQDLGEPRVIVGAAPATPAAGPRSFETIVISDRSAWRMTGELDGLPGDEIAVVGHAGADVLDPADFHLKTRISFGERSGQLWRPGSTLARLGEDLVVVQTGGGYSSTEVRGLDGGLLWQYRPDPKLPPLALRPADLDADGVVELYAAWHEAIVRLEGGGQQIWSRETARASLVALAPRTTAEPAWVVAHENGRQTRVWDEDGNLLATLTPPDRSAPVAVVELAQGRGLLLSGSSIRVIGLDGKILLEQPLEGMTVDRGLSVRFQPGDDPVLVVHAAAPRDVERWRLLLLASDGQLLYDEILAKPLRLLKARRADGGETLLLNGSRLSTMRPR